MVGWEFKSSTYQHIHIKYIPRHEASIWTDWVSHCRRCHRRQVPAFPRNLMTTDDPTVTNQCPCFTNKTFKEVRPVTGAISNTKPNYDPTSADHTRLTTRTTGTAEDIGTFWKWKLLKSCDELLFTTVFNSSGVRIKYSKINQLTGK